jgi:hypothetical protein
MILAKIASLEDKLKSVAIVGKFEDLARAGDIHEWNGSSKAISVTDFLTKIEQLLRH